MAKGASHPSQYTPHPEKALRQNWCIYHAGSAGKQRQGEARALALRSTT